ncbi:MAG: CRISPR-associated protein Cas4, partial [Desulfurococcales archaeon]|nr:CRISPR-associated protein Cas4 [Desulfurococcales archaeon]
ETGVPVDVGFLVSLEDGAVEPVCIGDGLRVEALKAARMGEEALESDPGIPEECPEYCVYRRVCLG